MMTSASNATIILDRASASEVKHLSPESSKSHYTPAPEILDAVCGVRQLD
jgi:hypothetical protein